MSLRNFREPFGKAGLVVACIALVFAMLGGAYAASGGGGNGKSLATAAKKGKRKRGGALTGRQKKEVERIAKKYAGKRGATGPVGSQGAVGPRGAAGANGARGATGTVGEKGDRGDRGDQGDRGFRGESVFIAPLVPENETGHCEEGGGAKFTNETGEAFACNGEGGEGGGYPNTLPSKHTETGFWQAQGEKGLVLGGAVLVTTISFPLPLATAPAETVLIDSDATQQEKEKCPGEAFDPEATPGVLCLYAGLVEVLATPGGPGAQTFGAELFFPKTYENFGSWAVTAP